MMGTWYRNQQFALPNVFINAAVFNFVYSVKWLSIGYSFDVTTSTLGLDQTFGAHEFGVNIRFDQVYLCKKKSRKGRVDQRCFMVNHKYLSQNKRINFLR